MPFCADGINVDNLNNVNGIFPKTLKHPLYTVYTLCCTPYLTLS